MPPSRRTSSERGQFGQRTLLAEAARNSQRRQSRPRKVEQPEPGRHGDAAHTAALCDLMQQEITAAEAQCQGVHGLRSELLV